MVHCLIQLAFSFIQLSEESAVTPEEKKAYRQKVKDIGNTKLADERRKAKVDAAKKAAGGGDEKTDGKKSAKK